MRVFNFFALAALAFVGVAASACDMQQRRDRENQRTNPAAPGEVPNPNQGVPPGPGAGNQPR